MIQYLKIVLIIRHTVLATLTLVFVEHVIHLVENAFCYAILADDIKDASKKEFLAASL